jgi:hypothetical protein
MLVPDEYFCNSTFTRTLLSMASSNDGDSYTYVSLPSSPASIRVLIILPGLPGEEINCRLEIVAIDSLPDYKALSYAWGPPLFTKTIFIKGAPFLVTENLFVALQHLRHSTNKQTFWIDAICINQLNISERNAQVQIMTSIYSNASLVLVWLGKTDIHIDIAWKLLEKWWGGPLPQKITEDEYCGLSKIFETAAWWSRLWVTQEVIFASTVLIQCGNHTLPWELFAQAFQQTQELQTDIQKRLSRIMKSGISFQWNRLAHQFHKLGHKVQLQRLENYIENWGTGKKCADKRDVIYVMLNIVPLRDDEPQIIPDYSKTVYEVFMELTRHMLVYEHKLSTLCNTYYQHTTPLTTNDPYIPASWSIDWSRHRVFESLINYFPTPGVPVGTLFYHATLSTEVSAKTLFHPTNPNVLILNSVVFDTVVSITGSYNDNDPAPWQPLVRSWAPKDLAQRTYPSGEDPTEAYIRTIFRDASRHPFGMPKSRLPSSQLPTHKSLFDAWSTGSYDSVLDNTHRITDGNVVDMKDFILALGFSTRMWCFFTTSKGYFGLAQQGARVGDTICVVDGACTPLMVRTAEKEAREALASGETGPCWTRVSAAYVHGIMDGEVMEMVEKGEYTKEKILLI